MSARTQRVAVIGTGIGGLTAAWLLKQRHQVTLFEQHNQPGMGIFSVDYASNGLHTRVDIPTRIFCEGYYPNLIALLNAIGVRMHASNHSAAFADAQGDIFFHYGTFNALGRSWSYPKIAGLPRAETLTMIREGLRFFHRSGRDATAPERAQQSFLEYLEQQQFDPVFTRRVLLPTLCVVCTCDTDSVLHYPADLLLGYLGSGVMKQGVIRAELGVADVVSRLVQGMEQVCGVEVENIEHRASGYNVTTADGRTRRYDRVVLATQAQQAAGILGPTSPLTPLLQQIPFEHSLMRVHTDATLLPRSTLPLSPVTYHLPDQGPRPEVTVDMTRAFPTYRRQQPVFQTWNPVRATRADTTLAEVGFTRPTVTLASRKAVAELRRIQTSRDAGLLLCGAYMADRVPLLEAAVDSAIQTAAQLGATPPWSSR